MNKKMLSIVIPVYNAEKYLKCCIESVINQTYSSWKMILVDDGSKDSSGIICDTYAEKDSRIRVVHQDNQGSVSARRNGVLAVETEYCCFLDADDTLPKNALEYMISEIPGNGSFVIIGNTERVFHGISIHSSYTAPCFSNITAVNYSHNEFIDKLYCSWFGITNVPVTLWGKLYPSAYLKETFKTVYDVVRFMGDDLIMTLDLMPKVDKVVIIPDVVYKYRVGGGTTKYQPEMMNDWLNLYRFKKSYAEKYPMPQNIQKLMDVELVNMTFSYFEMLNNYKKLTDLEISRICTIKEVVTASNNPDISPSFLKAKAIREIDVKRINQLLKKGIKQRVAYFIKKIIYKLA